MTNLFIIFLDNLLLLIFSIFFHISLFSVIKSGSLGSHLKITLNDFLEKRIYLIIIISFFLYIFISIISHSNMIFLDGNEVIVSTTINDVNFKISGEALTQIYQNLGSAAVFVAGTRIAAGLLAKHPMGLIPKVGTIGGTGAGFTITYRRILEALNQASGKSQGDITISAPVKINLEKIEHIDINNTLGDLLTNAFKPDRSLFGDYSTGFKFKNEKVFNIWTNKYETFLSDDNVINNNKVLKTLEEFNPNWKDSFISSPLESNNYILNTLSDILLLDYIILYLLFMLLIIISCKFIIGENIELKTIKRFVYIDLLSNLIKKYITIWQKSNILWIYFILISIMIFEMVSIFSINSVINILTNI